MSSVNDLDLSKVENEDVEKLVSKIESYYKNDSTTKTVLAYHWEKNHLMLDGQQWIVYDGHREAGGAWRVLKPSANNEYIPRPVTNYIFDAFQTLKSYLLKNKPRASVRPNTQTHRDKSAAKIGELILECNRERLHEAYNYEYAASCLLTYGTVFKKDYWDTSYLSLAKVPRMQQVPKTDPMTGQPTGEMDEVQVYDEQGLPVFDEIPIGDVNTAIVEPFRIALDPLAVNLHEARWIMEYSIRPLTWIVENYDKQEEGYTGRASEVKEEKSLSASMRRFFQLRSSSGVKGFNSGITSNNEGSSNMVENAAVVKEYYERPTRQYPRGRLIVVANSVPLYIGESPYHGPEQGDWHPYSECRWEIVPGRFWGKSPFDDATEVQRHINSIDSIVVLTRKTQAVPQKLVPQGSIAPGQWTGQPGQMVFFRPGPGGEVPQTIPAAGVDAQVFREREQRLEDFKNITGAVDILKGDRPPGVTAASALNLLFEVGTGKLYPSIDRWKMLHESSGKKQLRLVCNKYKEPRPEFIKQLRAKNKELTEDQIKNFIGEDLNDNTNVVIEAISAIPKLRAAEQAQLIELANMGALNLQDPANNQKFLEKFGVEGFNDNYSKDVKRAQWENDLLDNLLASPDNMPIVLDVDNHEIHMQIHSDRMKEPSFMELPFEVQQAYMQHNLEHEMKLQEKMQMQMMQQAAMQVPSGASASGGSPSPGKAELNADQQEMLRPDLAGPSLGVNE